MANVDWQGFLRGIRESIETIRTPIDPIAIQGTAHGVDSGIVYFSEEGGSIEVRPPSDGYNRVNVICKGPAGMDLLVVYEQPQSNSSIIGHALHNPLTGIHINPQNNITYTLEIPDRNTSIVLRSNLSGGAYLKCVFWRQY